MYKDFYFDESVYWFVVILVDIILSGSFGIMLAFLFTSNRLIKHNSNNTGKAFKDNCSSDMKTYEFLATNELWGQTPEIYKKDCNNE